MILLIVFLSKHFILSGDVVAMPQYQFFEQVPILLFGLLGLNAFLSEPRVAMFEHLHHDAYKQTSLLVVIVSDSLVFVCDSEALYCEHYIAQYLS